MGASMYQARFCWVEGLEETDVGNLLGLSALSDEEAIDEALALTPPERANFVKIIRDGLVISKHGVAL